MKLGVHVLLSLVLTVVVMFVWLMLANLFQWLIFTGWGMAHGGFVIAIPVSFAASFGALLLIPWFRTGWSRIALGIVGALVAIVFAGAIGLVLFVTSTP